MSDESGGAGDSELEELRRLVVDARGDKANEPFRPFAYYHDDLDFIYVLLRDCSVTEVRINDAFNILEANYPKEGQDKYVGFMINSARGFCIHYRLPYRGEIDLLDLVDRVMFIYPCPIPYQDEIYRILSQAPLTVNIPQR